jgi:uracil phosphoribosyltransferase
MSQSANHHVLSHSLVDHCITRLRAENTPVHEFHQLLQIVAMVLASECTRDLATRQVEVRTPLELTSGVRVSSRIGLVPVLRAGLGMEPAFRQILPTASVHHIGIRRDEATAQPIAYYDLRTEQPPPDLAIVLDPMLATGGSACAAVQMLQDWGVAEIRMAAIIAAPEGLKKMAESCPDVRIFTAALDRELNQNSYICPGLGDAGDRLFGTV